MSNTGSITTRGILDRLSSKAVSFVVAPNTAGGIKVPSTADDERDSPPTILSVRASFASATAESSTAVSSGSSSSSSSSKKNLVSAGTQAEPTAPLHVDVEDASLLPPLAKKGGKAISADVLQEAIQLVSLLEAQLAVSKQENQRLRKVTEQLVQAQSQSPAKLPQLSPGKYEGRQDDVLTMAYNVLERGDTLLNGYGMSGALRGGAQTVLEEDGEDDIEVTDHNYENGRTEAHQSRGREREVMRGRGGGLQDGGGGGGGGRNRSSSSNRPTFGRAVQGRGRDRSRSQSTDRIRERVTMSGQRAGSRDSRGRSVRDERRPRDRSTSRSQSVERRLVLSQQQQRQQQQRQQQQRQQQQRQQQQQSERRRREDNRDRQERQEDEYERRRGRPQLQMQGHRDRGGGSDDEEEEAWEEDREEGQDERILTRWVRLGTYQTFKAVQDAKRLRVRKSLPQPGHSVTRRVILPSSVGDWPTVLHYKSGSRAQRPTASLRGGGRRFQIIFDRARGQWVLEGEARSGAGRSSIYSGPGRDTRDASPQFSVAAAPRVSAIPPSYAIDNYGTSSEEKVIPSKSNPSYQNLLDRLYNTVKEMRDAAGAPSSEDVDEDPPPAVRGHPSPKIPRRFGHAKMRDFGYEHDR